MKQRIHQLIDKLRDWLGPGPRARGEIKTLDAACSALKMKHQHEIRIIQEEERQRINHIIDKLGHYHTEHKARHHRPMYAIYIEIPPELLAYGQMDERSQHILEDQIGRRIAYKLRNTNFVKPPEAFDKQPH